MKRYVLLTIFAVTLACASDEHKKSGRMFFSEKSHRQFSELVARVSRKDIRSEFTFEAVDTSEQSAYWVVGNMLDKCSIPGLKTTVYSNLQFLPPVITEAPQSALPDLPIFRVGIFKSLTNFRVAKWNCEEDAKRIQLAYRFALDAANKLKNVDQQAVARERAFYGYKHDVARLVGDCMMNCSNVSWLQRHPEFLTVKPAIKCPQHDGDIFKTFNALAGLEQLPKADVEKVQTAYVYALNRMNYPGLSAAQKESVKEIAFFGYQNDVTELVNKFYQNP